jgi:hypothetical protein
MSLTQQNLQLQQQLMYPFGNFLGGGLSSIGPQYQFQQQQQQQFNSNNSFQQQQRQNLLSPELTVLLLIIVIIVVNEID